MTVSKTAEKSSEKPGDAAKGRKDAAEAQPEALQLGELSEQLGYVLKRAQLKVFENFLRCMASLQLTPAQFSVLLLVEKNPSALVAKFDVSDAVEPNFLTRAKMGQSSDVYAVAITADGKALFAKKEVKVTLGGCGG